MAQATDREELEALRRLAFLEDKAAGVPQEQPEQQAEPRTFLQTVSDIVDFSKGASRSAASAATFGGSDIVGGAGRGLAELLFGAGDEGAVGEAFAAPTEERQAFEQQNPKTAIAANVAGAFVNPVGQAVGPLIAGGKGIVGKVGRGILGGAGLSTAQAGGEQVGEVLAETATDQEINIRENTDRILKAAGTGAAFGGAIPGAISTGKGVFTGIASLVTRFSSKTQGTKALRKVAEALERDGFTPSQALKRIDELGAEAALVDIGPNSRALGFTVFGIPGKGKETITKFLRGRQEGVRPPGGGRATGGQVQRIQDHIDELVPDNFFTQRQQLANLNKSGELYDAAYAANQQIESTTIDRILRTPSGRQAFKNARSTLQNLRKNVSKTDPELAEQLKETGEAATGRGVGKGLKLEFLDQVKRELFDLEELAKTPLGKATSRSRSITDLRRSLIDELDKVDVTAQAGPGSLKVGGGAYAQARLLAGDKLANQEALELGNKFMSKAQFSTPEELGVAIGEMSPEARHLFRVGAAQALKARIADVVSRADATKKLIDIQGLERKVDLAFGDEALFNKYTAFLENEKTLFRAVTDVLGNSKTAERLEALDDAGIDPSRLLQGFRDIAQGQTLRGGINVAAGLKERITTPPGQSEALAELLTGRNVRGLKEALPAPQITEGGALKSIDEILIRALSADPEGAAEGLSNIITPQ